jgi:L-asparaginase / beta-aspartyl-peptidase
MTKYLLILLLLILNKSLAQQGPQTKGNYVLVIHGGAGVILKSQFTPEKEAAYTAGINRALDRGNEILKNGGSALNAVEAAVRVLEDDSLFNAGKGAVFTNEGKNELDAAIMDGKTMAAGSIAGVTTIKNPISAARAVMEKSPHVMMIGAGAEKFAKQQGLEIVDPSYFYTAARWKALQELKAGDSLKIQLDHSDTAKKTAAGFFNTPFGTMGKYGTVGAVALDREGNLAAATSTGGMTNKKFGRVGDVPIIGAGTYANNKTVAISCTGWGEYFIRLVMAKTISDMMEYGKIKLKDAANEMVMKKLAAMGGDGGLIAVDAKGNIAMPFNSAGMYRGFIKSTGERDVKIFKE